jgi:hypothetical protein
MCLLCCWCAQPQEGNADAGRYQLETALDVLYKQAAVVPGCEGVLAGYHYKLARCAPSQQDHRLI